MLDLGSKKCGICQTEGDKMWNMVFLVVSPPSSTVVKQVGCIVRMYRSILQLSAERGNRVGFPPSCPGDAQCQLEHGKTSVSGAVEGSMWNVSAGIVYVALGTYATLSLVIVLSCTLNNGATGQCRKSHLIITLQATIVTFTTMVLTSCRKTSIYMCQLVHTNKGIRELIYVFFNYINSSYRNDDKYW